MSGKKERKQNSILSIFFMSLFYWQDLLDNHPFFLIIDLIKNGIPSGNMQPLDDSPAF